MAVAAALALTAGVAMADTSRPPVSFGTPIDEAEVAAWNIDVQTPTGEGLPAGSGSVAGGEKIFAAPGVACRW